MVKKKKVKRKQIKKQNIIQLILSFVSLMLIGYIASFLFFRVDLTSEKKYTLSPATKKLLHEINDVVYISVYLEGELNSPFRRLQRATRELLDELRVYSEYIEYEFIDPSENIDIKERNKFHLQLYKKGLIPATLEMKDDNGKVSQQRIFPGALVRYHGKEIPLDLLNNRQGFASEEVLNSSVESLEYEFTNAIRKLEKAEKQKIAFIEGHGELDRFELWNITEALSEFYTVERVKPEGKIGILDEYTAIIIAKPDSVFSDGDKFIIDQFIMKGGKVLWLIDGVSVSMDSLRLSSSTIAMANSLKLEDQLFVYGARINPDLVRDIQCASIPINTAVIGAPPVWKFFPWYYFPLLTNQENHPLVKNLDVIKNEFVSTVDTVGHQTEVKKTVLLKTSNYSKVITAPVRVSLDIFRETPDPGYFNKSYQPVAVLLEGTFKSVFSNRLVPVSEEGKKIKLLETSQPTKMIVAGDGDIIRNEIAYSNGSPYPLPLGADRWNKNVYYGGNKEFILNALNYLCDDEGLMSIRSREIKLRLLDKTKITAQRLTWQLINSLIPVIFVILFGIALHIIRKRKYAKPYKL